MKAYHKRLLIVALSVAMLMGVSGYFISTVFRVDAQELELTVQGVARHAEGLNRSDRLLPARDEIDADGYDTEIAGQFACVLENDSAQLYFNADTAEIALLDVKTGQVWYSNPQDRAQETMVEGTTRLRIGAQLTVTYYDSKGAFNQMDSYNDCIANRNMQYSVDGDELLVHYHFGKTIVTLADVPQQISASRMELFSSRLSEEDRKDLLSYYRLATIQGQEAAYIENLKAKYPNVVNEDTYYLTKDSTRILTKIRGYLDAAGYTWDDLDFDNRENQVETEATSRAYFDFTLSYRLEGRALRVALKGDLLDYEEKIPPYEVRLLEYFGAGNPQEKGYFLLPDGSGTLMLWNNGKQGETPFSLRIYGEDTVCDTESAYVSDRKASLPVFGIKNGSAGLLAVLEEGEALCSLYARTAGMQNSYNAAYPSIRLTAMDTMVLSDSQQIYFEETPYRGDIVIRYLPLDAEDADYMGMARVYRERLIAQGKLQGTADAGYPLMLDVIGAVPSTKIVAGVPVSAMESMTGYQEMADIAGRFDEAADVLWLRAEGWLQGGMDQSYMKGIQLESALGSRADFQALVEAAEERQWTLLPDVYLQSAFDRRGLSVSGHCIRDLCRDIAVRYRYDYLSRYRRYNGNVIYQLNAKSAMAAVNALIRDAQGYGLNRASVPDVGTVLYSDFTRNKAFNRVEMQDKQREMLDALSNQMRLSLSNPNAYALEYVDGIYDMPTGDSGFRATDESVPFYQAVVHGSIVYASEPLNYADDYHMAYLQAVEFGAGLQYTLTANTTALLKETDYQYLNKGHAEDWTETILQDYQKAADALAALCGLEMTGHDQLAFNVYATTYADGTRVVVNYNDSARTVAGMVVPARDFIVIKAGEQR